MENGVTLGIEKGNLSHVDGSIGNGKINTGGLEKNDTVCFENLSEGQISMEGKVCSRTLRSVES